jgi:hypothetical protein
LTRVLARTQAALDASLAKISLAEIISDLKKK